MNTISLAFAPRRKHAVLVVSAACILALAALRPQAAHSGQTLTVHSAPLAAKIKAGSAPIVAVNNKAILPDGATIEFVGISDFKTLPGSKEYHWWKPDGSPLTNAPSSFQLLSEYQRAGLPGNSPNVRNEPNRDFVLDTSGFDLNEVSPLTNFEPTGKEYISSGFTKRELRPNSTWRYDNVTWFSAPKDMRGVKTLHMRLSRGAWHTYASTTKLPTKISINGGTTIAFLHPGKHFMDWVGVKVGKFPMGNTALGVEFHSDKAIGMETRLVILDDKGKSTQLGHGTHIGDSNDSNFVKADTIPKFLLNHIKAYQLQARPYQYVDFPNIHMHSPVR